MATYWVAPSNPPSKFEAAWGDLHEAFGTEPFSRQQGLNVLRERYTHVPEGDLGRVLDSLATDGNLGRSEREF